jgi:hypothetical protein
MIRTMMVLGCAAWGGIAAGCTADGPRWYKGNTHAHTVICGHADSTPEHVARWYLDHGYHFLCLSEHNHFIDPAEVELPEGRRKDFILIPGLEVTGRKLIHTTALNVDGIVDWTFDSDHKHEIIQNHVDGTREAGGAPILNHPNFHYAVKPGDVLPVERLHLFELYNGHPAVNNFGDEQNISTERLWDILLTEGMVMYAVASDDAHHFQTWTPDHSNPGRGWIMVRAAELSPDSITAAIEAGDFYASSGVILEDVGVSEGPGGGMYSVLVDVDATMRELESDLLIGRRTGGGLAGFRVEAVGPGGRVLAATHEPAVEGVFAAAFDLALSDAYIRCRITYARPHEEGGFEEFYAWTQPHFLDGRLERLEEPDNGNGHPHHHHDHSHQHPHRHPHPHGHPHKHPHEHPE